VAILRAAIEEHDPYTKRTNAEAELQAVIDADGDTWIQSVFIERELPALKPAEGEGHHPRRYGTFGTIVSFLVMVGLVIVFFAGVVAVMEWILKYLGTH
jgi:hypothetical protein